MVAKRWLTFLIAGDLIAILVVTLIGFITHGETIASPRWLTSFLPLSAAWLLTAPWMGLYRPEIVIHWTQIWRVPFTLLLAAPLAGFFRGLLLNQSIVIIFVTVLALTAALGMILWRLAVIVVAKRAGNYG